MKCERGNGAGLEEASAGKGGAGWAEGGIEKKRKDGSSC
jgi:hypothetical protein